MDAERNKIKKHPPAPGSRSYRYLIEYEGSAGPACAVLGGVGRGRGTGTGRRPGVRRPTGSLAFIFIVAPRSCPAWLQPASPGCCFVCHGAAQAPSLPRVVRGIPVLDGPAGFWADGGLHLALKTIDSPNRAASFIGWPSRTCLPPLKPAWTPRLAVAALPLPLPLDISCSFQTKARFPSRGAGPAAGQEKNRAVAIYYLCELSLPFLRGLSPSLALLLACSSVPLPLPGFAPRIRV